MPKVINLNDIRIVSWGVRVDIRSVHVQFEILEDDGSVYATEDAIFWETVPQPGTDPDGVPIPNPGNWYQLPPAQVQAIIDLTIVARNALAHLINE